MSIFGIGDGGNEIGMGAIPDAVAAHIPHGPVLCSKIATDVLFPVGVSNWGCYALTAALAIMTGNEDLIHTPDLERRLLEASPQIGLVDGTTGRLAWILTRALPDAQMPLNRNTRHLSQL